MQRHIDVKKLDQGILSQLSQHAWLLDVVDAWILSPDARHLSELIKASLALRDIDPRPLPPVLYRGFSLRHRYQDTLGITTKTAAVGKQFSYEAKRPLSFSHNLDIAKAFGNVVVSMDSAAIRDHCICLSEELCYLISQRRRIQPQTQDEVIVFPSSAPLVLTVCLLKPKTLFW